jgi:hypothetical protein
LFKFCNLNIINIVKGKVIVNYDKIFFLNYPRINLV